MESRQFQQTSGATDAVWIHQDKYANRPSFTTLNTDLKTDVCIVGAGIAGISIAYELVSRGREVVLLEARNLLSGETGRTSGHLSNALDDGYVEIAKKHGKEGAKAAAESHSWALRHVGDVARKLGIECEYRLVPGYDISQYDVSDKKHHEEDMQELQEEAKIARELGIQAEFRPDLKIKGWAGRPDQTGGIFWPDQAAFHPTKYLVGVLNWLKQQPNFKCYTHTRVMEVSEHGVEVLGLGHKSVTVKTEAGQTITCEHAVEATCVPLQKLSVVAELEYIRTYALAVRVPKGSVEDCFIYDSAEAYKYIRLTACDDKDDYLIIGGCDHKVGQESPAGRAEELETWVRERFPQAGAVDYSWSGQVFEPVDYVAFIGKNQGNQRIYVVTGDSGNGLTHGTIAGRLIADEIEGKDAAADATTASWAKLYNPRRLASIAKVLPQMIGHDLQINAQYKRFLETDITDIEDLKPGCGAVLNPTLKGPVAVYKDESGKVTKMSALCPHLHGVVCWNPKEKSFDCPVHGSRFSKEGTCVMGPAKANLPPVEG